MHVAVGVTRGNLRFIALVDKTVESVRGGVVMATCSWCGSFEAMDKPSE